MDNLFACPRCSKPVIEQDANWVCRSCETSYPVSGGIVDFRCSRKDYYFNPVPRYAMAEIVAPAAAREWPRRVRRFLRYVRGTAEWVDNLVVDGRYAWKMFLELPKDARALDLGCGLGNLAKNLAPSLGVTYAMDLTWERLEFARVRFSLFNTDDDIVLLAGGDGPHLPFRDETLDVVFVSGVLEWVADDPSLWEGGESKLSKAWRMLLAQFGDKNPRSRQLAFLREIRRVLRPEGQLFVAIENRLNYEYFVGRPDHHSGLRYGSLLPRVAANVYSIVVNQQPYRTYTYSPLGYRRLLRDAGFENQEFFGLLPGYSKLAEMVPLETSISYWRRHRRRGLRARVEARPLFAPAFGIVASKGPRPKLIDRLCGRITEELSLGSGKELVVESFFVTAKDKGVLLARSGSDPIVVKLALNETARKAEERNRVVTETLKELGPLVPRPLTHGTISGVPYFVERAVAGKSLAHLWRDGAVPDFLEDVAGVLHRLNPDLTRGPIEPLSSEEVTMAIEVPLRRLSEALDGEAQFEEFARIVRRRLSRLAGRRGLVHGDFSVHNVFFHEGAISGVIDWESWARPALPVLDAVNLLDSIQRLRAPESTVSDTAIALCRGAWPEEDEVSFLHEQCERSGIGTDDIGALAVLYWLRHIGSQLCFHLQYDAEALSRRVKNFFAFVLEDPFS